jgi:hypothetical protein
MDALDVAFPDVEQVGTHSCSYITGLNPFTLAHCGPSPPCVRFVDVVTFELGEKEGRVVQLILIFRTTLNTSKNNHLRVREISPKMRL